MLKLFEDDPLAVEAISAIRTGNDQTLRRLLGDHPGLANSTITRRAQDCDPLFSNPLIGAATDWPGHFPNVGRTIAILGAAGADVNRRCDGPHRESPLHGAASSDDVEALDALLAAGANIDAPGAVIAGGTPLDDAIAFGQWHAASRLVEHGAEGGVWHAAALGLMDRLEHYFASGQPAARYPWGGPESNPKRDVNIAFWAACHGGQRAAAEYLLQRGAELNWVAPWDGPTTLDAARRTAVESVDDGRQAGGADVARWLE